MLSFIGALLLVDTIAIRSGDSALCQIENYSKPMPNISNILRDDIFSPEDKIRLLVLYAYEKGGISKGSRTLIWLGQFLVRASLAKIPRSEYP